MNHEKRMAEFKTGLEHPFLVTEREDLFIFWAFRDRLVSF